MSGHEIGGLKQNWGKDTCAPRPGPKTATGHSTSVMDRRTTTHMWQQLDRY